MKALVFVAAFVLIAVGLEVGFILWLRPLYLRGIKWPMLVIGIIASILLALGLIPPYFELWKRKGRVVGINFIFLIMDSSGALFSLLSVVVGNMDKLSLALYAVVLGLEIGIYTSQIIWYASGGYKVIREEKRARKEGRSLEKENSLEGSDPEASINSEHDSQNPDESTTLPDTLCEQHKS